MKFIQLSSLGEGLEHHLNLLEHCIDSQIPLYYHHRTTESPSLWFGIDVNADIKLDIFQQFNLPTPKLNFNISKIIDNIQNEILLLEFKLDQKDVDLIRSFGECLPKKITPPFLFDGNNCKELDVLHYVNEQILKIKNQKFPSNIRLNTPSLSTSISNSTFYYKLYGSYYFSNKDNDIYSDSNESSLVKIDVNNIFIDKENKDKLQKSAMHFKTPCVSEIPDSSPYYVPKDYRNHKKLCLLATIGYEIFEANISNIPKSKGDGNKLLKEKLQLSNQREAVFSYMLIDIAPNCKVKRKNKEKGIPQIKYLMEIDANLSDFKKENMIKDLGFSDEYFKFAKRYIE